MIICYPAWRGWCGNVLSCVLYGDCYGISSPLYGVMISVASFPFIIPGRRITPARRSDFSRPFVQKASGEQATKQATTSLQAPV